MQVRYYFRPDRYVVTFMDVASSTHSGNSTFQVELFWKAGTLTPGSIRVAWLGMGMTDALAGLMLTNQSTAPAEHSAASLVSMPMLQAGWSGM